MKIIGAVRCLSLDLYCFFNSVMPKLTNASCFLNKVCVSRKNPIQDKLILISIFITCSSVLTVASFGQDQADAQILPLPGPFQNGKIGEKDKAASTDYHPPKISLINDGLWEGKNVLRIRIADDSNINSCIISYVKEGVPKSSECVHDHDDVYKALISSSSPNQNLEIYAEDGNGNSSTKFEQLVVLKQTSFFEQIFRNLFERLY
jgi:hypothetical protein